MRNYIILFLSIVSITVEAQTEIPKITEGEQVIEHNYYTLSYSEKHEQARWVAYELTKEELKGTEPRKDDFRIDPKVETGSATLEDYKGSGYDRGHLAPAADMKMNTFSMSESFFMSNMSPQHPSFNRGIWKGLEENVRTWVINDQDLYVVTGPVFRDNLGVIGNNNVTVPGYYYKVILKKDLSGAVGFVLPNKKPEHELLDYIVTVDSIEALTGIDFFHSLEDSLENKLESEIIKVYSKAETGVTRSMEKKEDGISKQCKGIAKSTGKRCKKMTTNENGYCHYHSKK